MATTLHPCEKVGMEFAERYDVAETPTGCRLTWTLALDVTAAARLSMPLARPLNNLAFRWFLGNLRRYTDERFGVAARYRFGHRLPRG